MLCETDDFVFFWKQFYLQTATVYLSVSYLYNSNLRKVKIA